MKTINVYHRSSKLSSVSFIFIFIVLSATSSNFFFYFYGESKTNFIRLQFVFAEAQPYSTTFADSFEGKDFLIIICLLNCK